MKIVRFEYNNVIQYGKLNCEKITVLAGEFPDFSETNKVVNVQDVKILAPSCPSKIVCLGLNYRDHAEEFNLAVPTSPVLFMKPPTTVVGDGADVINPIDMSHRLDYEAELAIVIGKEAKCVAEADVNDYIYGFTCGNDITARDLQPSDGQWTLAKCFDTFMPLGPCIETEFNYNDANITAKLNGEIRQSSNISNLIFKVPYIVSYLSKIMTLNVGDVIITGTPSGIGKMNEGDKIEVEIEGIGTLTNYIVDRK